MGEQDWYSNKDLFEMIQSFKNEVTDLTKEMAETKTLIRDYNGLRGNINKANEKIAAIEKKIDTGTNSRKEYIGYIIAVISIVFLLLNYFK